MTRSAAFQVLIALASSAAGANLTADQQAAAVASVREYARNYTESLPNYTCIQATKQTVVGASAGTVDGPRRLLAGVVEIEEEMSFVNRREVRKLTKINGSPASDVQPDPITFSRGEFGNLLDIILDPNSGTEIHWDREAKLEGRQVYVFAYRVPESSGYTLLESKGQIKLPFEGFVYADRRTAAVVRIEMKGVKTMVKSEYSNITITLDYKPAAIDGKEYLLPYGFAMEFGMTRNVVLISAQYKSYRRFSADSTITFDQGSDNSK